MFERAAALRSTSRRASPARPPSGVRGTTCHGIANARPPRWRTASGSACGPSSAASSAERLDVKRQDRVPGRAGQPDRARLRDARRPARTVHVNASRTARRPDRAQLHERAAPAARRRSARRPVAEPRNDPRDPLAVEVLAGDHDDAAVAEVVERREDPPVPERHDRLAAGAPDRRRSAASPRLASASVRPSARDRAA